MTLLEAYLGRCPLVAILRGVAPEEAIEIVDALSASGFSIVEVPLNSPDPLVSIEILARGVGEGLLIGAGTVLEPKSVDEVFEAGGRLIVAPNADPAVVARAKALGMAVIPGVATPTEAFAMLKAGADALKLFPAEGAPPAVLKAMRAVLPKNIPILPVGGITPESMAGYVAAGANGFGLGSALYKPGDKPSDVAKKAAIFQAEWTKLSGKT